MFEPVDVVGKAKSVEPAYITFHENVCTFDDCKAIKTFCPLTGVPVGALIVNVPATCVLI